MLQRSIAAADTGVGNAMRAATLGHSRAILDRSSGNGAGRRLNGRGYVSSAGGGSVLSFSNTARSAALRGVGLCPWRLPGGRPRRALKPGPGLCRVVGHGARRRCCLSRGRLVTGGFVPWSEASARPLRRTPAGRTGLWRTILPDGIAGTTAPRGGADLWKQRHQVKCWARCLFISNMVTLSWPNTFRSFSSARISRRFSGFCRLCDRM